MNAILLFDDKVSMCVVHQVNSTNTAISNNNYTNNNPLSVKGVCKFEFETKFYWCQTRAVGSKNKLKGCESTVFYIKKMNFILAQKF